MQDKAQIKLPKKAIQKAYWYKMFFRAGGGYTYSMGAAQCAVMGIILTALYSDKSKIGEELKKYARYYDTNIPFDGLVSGVIINMEEQRANNPDLMPAETIMAMQTSLMGPVGNIGDIIQQAIVAPLALSIGISLAGDPLNPHVIGPITSIILTATATIGISYSVWMQTYKVGNKFMDKIISEGLSEKILRAATIMGTLTMGAMIPKYIKLTTPLAIITKNSKFVVQTQLLDALVPNVLPLLLVLFFIKIFNKGAKPARVIWITMIVAAILSVIGIIGPVPIFD